MSKFSFCKSDTRSYMFQTYCTSYYGCPLWKLDSNAVSKFYTTWRKCIRKVWNVSRMTHCNILKHLYGGPCIEAQILSRYLMFYITTLESKNPYVSMCSELCRRSNTAAASNLRCMMSVLNFDFNDIQNVTISKMRIKLIDKYACNEECLLMGSTARELCLLRDGTYDSPLDIVNITQLLNHICID